MTEPFRTTTEARALGAVLRERRRAQGLTQTDLAAAAGVSLRFVSEIERGRASAGIGGVLRVALALGLELSVTPR